jgi:hypothetical protein
MYSAIESRIDHQHRKKRKQALAWHCFGHYFLYFAHAHMYILFYTECFALLCFALLSFRIYTSGSEGGTTASAAAK